MNHSDSSFYFAIKHQQISGDNTGYKKFPLGQNEIEKLLLKLGEDNGEQGTLTILPFAKPVFQGLSIQTYRFVMYVR